MPITLISFVELHTEDSQCTSIFKQQLNTDIEQLNTLIDIYNTLTLIDIEQRKKSLIDILRYKRQLEQSYSGQYIKECKQFVEQIHHRLFTELQQEFMLCGVNNIHGIGEVQPLPVISPGDTLSPLLANMSPQKIDQLAAILLDRDWRSIADKLSTLYLPDEQGGLSFRTFLDNNQITNLSNINNKLFKIQPINGAAPYILKMESREAGPELPEEMLRNGPLKSIILPSGAKRQCVAGEKTYNISTIPFCDGRDLFTFIKTQQFNQPACLRDIFTIYSQMVTVLLTMQENHIVFPDMKNTNWLISTDNQLFISDTKSFLTANPEDNTLLRDLVCQTTNGNFLHSVNFLPPEVKSVFCQDGRPISIDKIHAYILGLNMYQYLVACSDNEVVATRRNMADPVFSSSGLGQGLREMIERLLEIYPETRMSLVDAQTQLKSLLLLSNNKLQECDALISRLETDYQYGVYDTPMKDFLTRMRIRLRPIGGNSINYGELDTIYQELTVELTRQQQTIPIKQIISAFKERAGFFTIGMRKKAHNIENAMAQVPVEKRAEIMKQNCVEGFTVRSALSQHRLFTLFRSKPQGNTELSIEKAAKSYQVVRASMGAGN